MTRSLPMTRGRVLALLIGVPLALIVIGWTALTWVAYAGQGSYPVRLDLPVAGPAVHVSLDSGDMYVAQEPGGRLRLSGTAHYSLVRSTVTWHSTRSGVTVSSRCHFVTGECSFNYHVVVPTGSRPVLTNSSGDMTLQGLTGHVDAVAGSGDVHAAALSGAISIQDSSGDISGAALSGPAAVLSAGSGNITVTGLHSVSVTVSDGSGDVTLTFATVPGRVQVNAGSGNVTLVLPRGNTLYHVAASAASGRTTVRVPTSSASPHLIAVTDQSGDVSVTN